MEYRLKFLPCDCDTCKAAPDREMTLRRVVVVLGGMFAAESGIVGGLPRDVCNYSFASAAATAYAEYLGIMLATQARHAPERDPETALRFLTERMVESYNHSLETNK